MDNIVQDTMLFFNKHPAVYPLYEEFQKKLILYYPKTKIKVQKSQISFYNRYLYACVSFLRVKKKAELPDNYFVLTLGLPAPLESDRGRCKDRTVSGAVDDPFYHQQSVEFGRRVVWLGRTGLSVCAD